MITHMKFASIPVTDQDRALKFYVEKLGFIVEMDTPLGDGQRWIKLATPEGKTRVVLFTFPEQTDRIGTASNIVFATKDVQKTYEHLHQKGVSFVSQPVVEPWGTYAQFKDPDGNLFILSSED